MNPILEELKKKSFQYDFGSDRDMTFNFQDVVNLSDIEAVFEKMKCENCHIYNHCAIFNLVFPKLHSESDVSKIFFCSEIKLKEN